MIRTGTIMQNGTIKQILTQTLEKGNFKDIKNIFSNKCECRLSLSSGQYRALSECKNKEIVLHAEKGNYYAFIRHTSSIQFVEVMNHVNALKNGIEKDVESAYKNQQSFAMA